MLKEKLSIERRKAVMITADFTAPTTKAYAMAWLSLCNNARGYISTHSLTRRVRRRQECMK